jgi:ATP-binding cassette, subfamily C (CFTR/MRP), member 1
LFGTQLAYTILTEDDSLSAVDAHVGRSIFDKVIGPKGMLKSKARIFVTHNIPYLSYSDKIMLMGDGVVKESGTFQELFAKHGETFEVSD